MPNFLPNGNLVPGIHNLSWDEFVDLYGYTQRRRDMIAGLERAMKHLAEFGCRAVYIDGSFVSKKHNPSDYDACWDDTGEIDEEYLRLYQPYFITNAKEKLKAKYGGEFIRSSSFADWDNRYLAYYQRDKQDLSPKGIIRLEITVP